MFVFGKKSKKRLQRVDSRLQEVMKRALELSLIDFGIPEYGGLRTAEEQWELFQTGKSKADGMNKKSYHQTGKAVDIYAYVEGKASWDECYLSLIATAVLQAANELGYKVTWGGLWKNFRDMPHFQVED
jgi:peptidoglycan L-alanyl-D-glutamate endopeptidase CwlK